jgi:hypothetical protein
MAEREQSQETVIDMAQEFNTQLNCTNNATKH